MHWVSTAETVKTHTLAHRIACISTSVKNGDDVELLLNEGQKATQNRNRKKKHHASHMHNERGFYLNALYITLDILLITFTCINSQSEVWDDKSEKQRENKEQWWKLMSAYHEKQDFLVLLKELDLLWDVHNSFPSPKWPFIKTKMAEVFMLWCHNHVHPH